MNTNEDSIFLELEDAEVVNHMIIGKAMTMFLKGTKTIQENSSSEEFNVQKKEQMQIAHVLNILNQNKEIVKENVVDNELLGETVKELLNLKTSSRILAKAIKYHLDQHEKIMLFGNKPSCETCEEIFKSLIEDVDSNKIKMLPTGFKYLDINLNGGLSENGIHILAGPSGKGKSAFSIQIANYAASNGKVVLYFSIEMSPHQNLARVISSIDDSLSSKDILANTLTSEQKVRLKSIENRLKHQKLIFSKSRNIQNT